jgi:amino acid transporter
MGVTITYNTGLRYGGPVSMTLGWLFVSVLNGCVALSMAEICSAYPTSGGLYYWSAKLAGKDWAPFASWLTGWYASSIHSQYSVVASSVFVGFTNLQCANYYIGNEQMICQTTMHSAFIISVNMTFVVYCHRRRLFHSFCLIKVSSFLCLVVSIMCRFNIVGQVRRPDHSSFVTGSCILHT